MCKRGSGYIFLAKDLSLYKPDFLRDNEIRELVDLCSIGSNSVSHTPLSQLGSDQLDIELIESKAWLENVTGQSITAFSAPYGFLNQAVHRRALQAGYTLVGNSVEWWNKPSAVNIKHLVNRIAIRRTTTMSAFTRIVNQEMSYLVQRRLRGIMLEPFKKLIPHKQFRLLRSKLVG